MFPEEALRRLLDGDGAPVRGPLPTDGMPGGQFLIDLDDKEALPARFDEEDLEGLRDALPPLR